MNEMKDPRRSAAGKPRLLENPEVATKSPSPPPKGGGDEILHPGSSIKKREHRQVQMVSRRGRMRHTDHFQSANQP